MCNDISFCANTKCEKTNCRRHISNVSEKIYTMSQFSDGNGDNCLWLWEKE